MTTEQSAAATRPDLSGIAGWILKEQGAIYAMGSDAAGQPYTAEECQARAVAYLAKAKREHRTIESGWERGRANYWHAMALHLGYRPALTAEDVAEALSAPEVTPVPTRWTPYHWGPIQGSALDGHFRAELLPKHVTGHTSAETWSNLRTLPGSGSGSGGEVVWWTFRTYDSGGMPYAQGEGSSPAEAIGMAMGRRATSLDLVFPDLTPT